jgi:toxin ParE1/3/4
MRVIWARPALADLDEIQDYVAQDSPVAAYKLVSEIFERTERVLSTIPLAGRPGRVSDTRELVLTGTSFIVAYRMRETVEVLAVIHMATEWPDDFK